MGPKRTATKASSSTSKAVNDFLAQSTVPAGQMQILENEKKQAEKFAELKEKYLDRTFAPSAQLNFESVNQSRVITNIFVGITAGIFGLGAFEGVTWWVLWSVITSVILAFKLASMGFEADGKPKYFETIMQGASSQMFSNIMNK